MISEEKLTQKFSIWGFVWWPLKKKEGNHYAKGCLLLRRQAPKSGKCGGVASSLLFFSNHGIWWRATRPAPLSVACRPVLSQIPFFAGGQQHIWRKKRRRKLFFFLPFWREKKSRPGFCPLLPPSGDVQRESSFRGNCIRFWDRQWQQSAHCLFPFPLIFEEDRELVGCHRPSILAPGAGLPFPPLGSSSPKVPKNGNFENVSKYSSPLHSKESGPESMNQEICPLAFIPESITHTHRHRLPFFFLFRPQMDTFPVLYLPLGFPQSGCQSIRFLLGKKYSVLKGRKRRLLLLSVFFCGSGPTGIRGEMEQKRSVFFFGSNSSGFFCGVFFSLPLPTWTPEKEDELCKHFLLEYAAKARQIE